MVMLEVVHVTKRYRKVLANDDINLTIEDGRIGARFLHISKLFDYQTIFSIW